MKICHKHGFKGVYASFCPWCQKERELQDELIRLNAKPVYIHCEEESKEELSKENVNFNTSGSKYLRAIPCVIDGKIDVYAVLDAFNVVCPARQHAIKKLLCSGIRGKGDTIQDLNEAKDAIIRAIQMEEAKSLSTALNHLSSKRGDNK